MKNTNTPTVRTLAAGAALGATALVGAALVVASGAAGQSSTNTASMVAATEFSAGDVVSAQTDNDSASPESDTDAQVKEGHKNHGWSGHGAGGGHIGHINDTLTEVLSLDIDEIRALMHDEGQSLAEIANAQGVAAEDLIDALVIAQQTLIDEALADATIDEDHAAELSATLQEHITNLVNGAGHQGWTHDEEGHQGWTHDEEGHQGWTHDEAGHS